jgi:SAM-dependent methyltransferase
MPPLPETQSIPSLSALYHHPAMYDAVRPLDRELALMIDRELAAHLEGEKQRIFDPACGPGRWLGHFVDRGWKVAGNDLSESMVQTAAANLGDACIELTQRDMRDLCFSRGPFDAAVEPSGVLSELPTEEDFVQHLVSVGAHLRSGGVYVLVTLIDDDPRREVEDSLLHHVELEFDHTRVVGAYRLLERVPRVGWRIRRSVRVWNSHPMEEIADEYTLRATSIAQVYESARDAGFVPLAVRCAEEGEELSPDRPWMGECVFVLRKP